MRRKRSEHEECRKFPSGETYTVRKFTSVSGRRFRRASRWAAEGPARRVCSGPDGPGCSTAWTQPSVEAGPRDWSQVDRPCCPCRVSVASYVPPPPDGAGCAAGRSTSTCLRSAREYLLNCPFARFREVFQTRFRLNLEDYYVIAFSKKRKIARMIFVARIYKRKVFCQRVSCAIKQSFELCQKFLDSDKDAM